MGRLITSTFVSLDNLMSDEHDDMTWVIDSFDPQMGADMGSEIMNSMQAIIIGRTTYEIMVKAWPNQTEAEAPGADQMNRTPKLVFSRSLEKAEWGTYDNATVVKDIVPDEIERMKGQSDDPLVIMGSARLIQGFTNLGLIDEYVLLLHPVILGKGKPLFEGIDGRRDLRLTRAKPYQSGAVQLRFEPTT